MDNRSFQSGAAAAAPTAPVSPSAGYPTNGNPGTGTPASVPGEYWFHQIGEELRSLIVASGLTPAAGDLSQLLNAVLPKLKTGVALPVSNIGPIWHDDFNSIMTWQAFTANGAAYTGYASVLVGSLLADTQPTPRAGYIESGASSLGRAAYAGLRGWAMHNGIMVASGVWAAGEIAVKDNVDGTTFTIYDVRGEFPRFWDNGRGVDSGRVFGIWQKGTELAIDSVVDVNAAGILSNSSGAAGLGMDAITYASSSYYHALTSTTATVAVGTAIAIARPRNTALLASIKF